MSYKNTFTNYELLVLNNSSYRQGVKESLMSVYAYIIKHSKENPFTISFTDLLKMYNRYHNQLKLSTFKKRIARLSQLGLISVGKVNHLGYKLNSYVANRTNNVTDKVTPNVTEQEICLDLENTIIEVCEEKPKAKTLNIKKIIDIDNKNSEKKSYTEFMDSQEKVKEVETVINAAKQIFKNTNVTDKQVQETVINQLTKYFNNITVKFLDKYILTTIAKVKSDLKGIRLKVSQQNKANKVSKTLRFNNFDQRVYDYDSLERGLLGWEETTAEECTKEQPKHQDNYNQNQTNGLKFNNFDQRDYDYNDLEKKLLGWSE